MTAWTWSVVAVLTSSVAAVLVLPPRAVPPPTPERPSDTIGTTGTTGTTGAAPRDSQTLRWVATGAVGLGVWLVLGGVLGPPVAAVGAAGCWWLAGRLEPPSVRRRRERLAAAVPQGVDLMAACLTAGLSPGASLDRIAAAVQEPLAAELAGVSSRLRLGVDPVTVWRDLAGHPQLAGMGRALARAVESGASVAEAMQRLAEDLRRDNRARVEARARAVGVKAALPLGLCLLPAFVLVGVVPLVAGSVSVILR